MTGQSIVPVSRGFVSQPEMGWESQEFVAPSSSVLGHGNPTTLHALTLNSVGVTSPVIQVWKIYTGPGVTPLGSVSTSLLSHAPGATGATFWYDADAMGGWIVNFVSGIGDLTVTYRENQ